MTYKFYKISMASLFSLLAFYFLFHDYINEWLHQMRVPLYIIFYTTTLLSLCCMYISIYALLSKVEPVKKIGRPAAYFGIACSLILLLGSITPPVLGYLSALNIDTDSSISNSSKSSDLERLYDGNKPFNFHKARLYYLKTNEQTEYIDENGDKVLYIPNKSDQLYIQNRQNYERLKKNIRSRKKSFIILMAIVIVSFISFLLFLRYMKKIGKIGNY